MGGDKRGFTLIEMVVVIIILAILTILAAPKFMNLQDDARHAALQGLKGAMESAMGITYGKAVIQGLESLPTSHIPLATGTIAMQFGYPEATASGIIAATGSIAGSDWVYITAASNNTEKNMPLRAQQENPIVDAWREFVAGNKIDNVLFKGHYSGGKPLSIGQCQFFSQGEVLHVHDVPLSMKPQCLGLNEYIKTLDDTLEPAPMPDVSGSSATLLITFPQYFPLLQDPARIPFQCYLTYIAAPDSETPARIELAEDACKKKHHLLAF